MNEKIEHVSEISKLKADARIWQIEMVVQQEMFVHLAKTAATYFENAAEGDDEKQSVLKKLKLVADQSLADVGSLLIRKAADDLVMLAKDLFAHDAALKVAQDQYFDGRPILFLDTEDRLCWAIKKIKICDRTL